MNLVVIPIGVFIGLVVSLEIGYRLGVNRLKKAPNAHEGFGAIEGAVFGLVGLLLSLTFFGAASRLDAGRQLIVQEANAIASAYQRVDLLPNAEQPEVRRLFREYLDERVRISVSLTVSIPTGEYDAEKLVNLGEHRWSFTPEFGVSYPFGPERRWEVDAYINACFFTDNTEYRGVEILRQEPLPGLEGHLSYSFTASGWASLGLRYSYRGGTIVDGLDQNHAQENLTAGAEASLVTEVAQLPRSGDRKSVGAQERPVLYQHRAQVRLPLGIRHSVGAEPWRAWGDIPPELAAKFPKRMQLSENSVASLEGEISEWIDSRPIARLRPAAEMPPTLARGVRDA